MAMMVRAVALYLCSKNSGIVKIPTLKKYGKKQKATTTSVTTDMACGISAHADKLLGRDIRSDQRKADQPPAKTSACKEVIFAGLFLSAFEKTETDNSDDESKKYSDVNCTELHNMPFPFVIKLLWFFKK